MYRSIDDLSTASFSKYSLQGGAEDPEVEASKTLQA
jgi:hypothetical protein